MLWTGRILTGLMTLFMLMDGGLHVANPAIVAETTEKLGFPDKLMPALGVIELIALAMYLYPRTATLGAILLTGYFGGAIATQVRVDGPFFMPVLFAALIWAALYCRDQRIRNLIA